MIEATLMRQGAEKLGLRVSDHRVDATIRQDPIFQVNGSFSPDMYRRFLNNMGMTESELKSLVRQNILQKQLYSALAGTNFMVEPEYKAFLDYYYQKRSFKYTVIEREPIAAKIKVSDDEIQAFSGTYPYISLVIFKERN